MPTGRLKWKTGAKQHRRPAGRRCSQEFSGSEPELWAQADAQVVMRAIVEKDVVADFRAHSDRSGKGFQTASRIEGELGCATAQAYGGDKAGGCALASHIEVLKSNFARQKQAQRTRARLKLRTEQPVQNTHFILNGGNGEAVVETIAVISPEVVAHFCFQLYAGVNIERRPSAHTDVIDGGTGVGKAEIFGEDANLHVIAAPALLRQQNWSGEEKRCKNKS